MKIRLFPGSPASGSPFFGLFRLDGRADIPRPIDWDTARPIHLIHSEPDHLGYLVALLVLQAWTTGLDESHGPVPERRPIVVVTSRPSRFAEAYLRIHIPADQIRHIPACRRRRLYERRKRLVGEEYWDSEIPHDETRTRLHNFFPAFQLWKPDAEPRAVASQQYLGRVVSDKAAVIVCRPMGAAELREIRRRYLPLLEIFEQDEGDLPPPDPVVPRAVFHESIFARMVVENDEQAVIMPDSTFEDFCAASEILLVEPLETDALRQAFRRLDDALHALDDVRRQGSRVMHHAFRTALRLRKLLLSIPTGVELFEQALVHSELPPELRYECSVSEPIRNLESRMPEVATQGEWAEYVMSEVLATLRVLAELLTSDTPKRAAVSASISQIIERGRKACVVVDSQVLADALGWVFRLQPVRPDLPGGSMRVISTAEIARLRLDEDCVLHQPFDPNAVFPALARAGPRRVTLVLWGNELRFVGESFRGTARRHPGCAHLERILRPILEQLDRLAPSEGLPGGERPPGPMSTEEFQRVRDLFLATSGGMDEGVVWLERPEREGSVPAEAVQAFLVRLEGDKALFIEAGSRVPFVQRDDDLDEGGPEQLGPGVRLLIVNAAARDLIARKTLDAKREVEAGEERTRLIVRWRVEMEGGRSRRGMTYVEVCDAIKRKGSTVTSPQTVGLWARGEALGPSDPEDIWRVGEAVGSQWLTANWREVAQALRGVRSDHRVFGREITRLIQRVAAGHQELSAEEGRLLEELGVGLAELQDAVSLLRVVGVSSETTSVPADQVGMVIRI